jgi:plastocyanin
MRTAGLAVALALTLVGGCVAGEIGTPASGDDDDDVGSNPTTPTPRVNVSVDKPLLATELMTTNMVTITAQAAGGFAGPVMLNASVVDAGGAAMPGWTVTLNNPMVTLAAGGSATAVATIVVPAENKGLTGMLKVDASSSAGATTTMSTVNVANQVTFVMKLTGGNCTYPTGTLTVKVGTKVRWVNTETASRITIHMDRPVRDGLVHQDDPGSAPGAAYERVTALNANGALSGTSMSWYCHAPGPDLNGNNPKLLVVP